MNVIGTTFHILFYQPILNALIGLYVLLPFRDFGIAIILLTVLLRVALHPLSVKALRSQRALQELQPKLKAVREKHKKNTQETARATMALYKEHGINPFGGFLPILIQLPILFALYKALIFSLGPDAGGIAESLYAFIPHPETISSRAFGGLLDLTARSPVLAVLAGLAQYAQSSLTFSASSRDQKKGKGGDFASALSFQMRFVFPIMLAFIAGVLPSGVALYLVATTLFSAVQQSFFNRSAKKAKTDSKQT